MNSSPVDLAIIGSGPSAIYLLQHIVSHIAQLRSLFRSVSIFEKSALMGYGMPYSPETTDLHNLANISSSELPALPEPFSSWLRGLDDSRLAGFGINRGMIDDDGLYSRLALGAYFNAQYNSLLEALRTSGIPVTEHPATAVSDIIDDTALGMITLVTPSNSRHAFGKVVIATGHNWKNGDRPHDGYYSSPWPIFKILPRKGEAVAYTVGTLGASLSAFDVLSSLAHRHGVFKKDNGTLTYHPLPGCSGFSVSMHSMNGWLPHIQYEQENPLREIYRHTDRNTLLALRDEQGFLRLDTYFDQVCRPALSRALADDGITTAIDNPSYGIREFVEEMESRHEYDDPFEGMRRELTEARKSVQKDQPIRWKEVTDDLMYTLNYHAELMAAEDHIRFHKLVMPFLMNVIAAMPISSAETILALRDAGKLDLIPGKASIDEGKQKPGLTRVTVEDDGETTEIDYRMFIECGGQDPLEIGDYPFPSLVQSGAVRAARIPFAETPPETAPDFVENGRPFFKLAGIDIDASHRVIGADGTPSLRITDIAFPHTLGMRPYSYGLQACSATSEIVVLSWIENLRSESEAPADTENISQLYNEIGEPSH